MPLPHPLALTEFLNIYEAQLKQRGVLGHARDLLSWQFGWNNPEITLQSSAEFKERFNTLKTNDDLITLIIDLGDKADEVQAKSYNYSAFSETLHAIRSYCVSKVDQNILHLAINKRYTELKESPLEPKDSNRFSKYIIYLNADEFCLNTKFIEELFPRNKYQYQIDATLPNVLQKDFHTQYLRKHYPDSLDPIADLEKKMAPDAFELTAVFCDDIPKPRQNIVSNKRTFAEVLRATLLRETQPQNDEKKSDLKLPTFRK